MPEPEPEIPEEEFNAEDITNAYDPEPVVETATTNEPELETNTNEELPTEEVAMVEQEPELDNGEVVGEETMPVQEESAVPVSDESTEEIKEEIIEEEAVEEKPEVSVDIVKVEKYIDGKVQSQIEKIEATLVVVNELVSRAMVSNQVDISSYATINAGLFDNRQLPKGNQDFFNQIVLAGYDKSIYTNQVTLGSTDPVAQHNIKVDTARNETNQAYLKLQELINERNGI